jgi:hypothetical protein
MGYFQVSKDVTSFFLFMKEYEEAKVKPKIFERSIVDPYSATYLCEMTPSLNFIVMDYDVSFEGLDRYESQELYEFWDNLLMEIDRPNYYMHRSDVFSGGKFIGGFERVYDMGDFETEDEAIEWAQGNVYV